MSRSALAALVTCLTIAACAGKPALTSSGTLTTPDGVSLHFEAMGQGPDTALVLHGGPGLHSRYLEPALADLAQSHTLIFYDQRGRGQSGAVTDTLGFSLDRDLADLETVRAHFGLARVALVGHHYGALLGTAYARRHPDRVTRLLLVSPIVPRMLYYFDLTLDSPDSLAVARFMAARAAGQHVSDPIAYCRGNWGFYFTPAAVTEPGVVTRLTSAICDAPAPAIAAIDSVNHHVLRSLGNWDWRDTVAQLAMPVLVIAGEPATADSASARRARTLLHAAKTWADAASDGRFLAFGGPSFFPWLEHPAEFTDASDVFLRGQFPAAARQVSGSETRPGDATP